MRKCHCGDDAVIFYGIWETPLCEPCAIDLLVKKAQEDDVKYPHHSNHKNWPAGMLVTTKVPQRGYGSKYSHEPGVHYFFEPGMVGVVHSTPPPVMGRRQYFLCVDWCCPVTGRVERCAVWPEDAKKVKVKK